MLVTQSKAQRTAMTQPSITIPKVRFAEPRRNLPGYKGVATPEDRFTIAFARAYLRQVSELHHKANYDSLAFAREVSVNGYGIADIFAVAWLALPNETFPNTEAFSEVARPCTRAFECKLGDWRRAVSQALRYRFFAHQSLVVLPEATCVNALPFLNTFQKIHVGLWSYSSETDRIRAHYTPRPATPISKRWHLHAIHAVASVSTQSLPISRKG